MSIQAEIDNIFEKDPAARSKIEVLLCYPGLHAILLQKFTHKLWQTGNPTARLAARAFCQIGRFITGIEIHPGARLGARVFIDHGAAVVVGETAEVGDDCTIYQGVTLGAQAAARMGAATRDKKRHPTLGKGVVVGSGAQVLGSITVGDNAQIASGSIVVKEVPENSVVVGVPGRVVMRDGLKVQDPMPDIEAEAIKALRDRTIMLERQIARLNVALKNTTPEPFDATPPVVPGQGMAADPVDVFLHGAGI
jgi:serine O-acetyltransferase